MRRTTTQPPRQNHIPLIMVPQPARTESRRFPIMIYIALEDLECFFAGIDLVGGGPAVVDAVAAGFVGCGGEGDIGGLRDWRLRRLKRADGRDQGN